MKIATIAMLCHAVNAAYFLSQGDESQPSWEDAPDWQKDSILMGVEMHLNNPDASPEQSHESWYAQKEAEGWKYGEVKDAEKKEHPCFLPYAELPDAQKAKDYLFKAVVHLVKNLHETDEITELSAQIVQLQSQKEHLQGNLNNFKQSLAVSQGTQSAAAGAVTGVRVKYQGNKAEYQERLYSSNLTFTYGQVRSVPAELAKKLLKHPEFIIDEETGVAASDAAVDNTAQTLRQSQKENKEADTNKERDLDAIDQIRQMTDKDSLVQYAMLNFGQKMAKNLSVEKMQEKVINLIDTIGVSKE